MIDNREVKIQLEESRPTLQAASEIAFTSVIETPFFEYLQSCLSLETAPCTVVDRSSVAQLTLLHGAGCCLSLKASLLCGADCSRRPVSVADVESTAQETVLLKAC